ncbi:hypothetical protein [Leucobacter salsicius]|uniref:hypothetical protein n=1 Tax=Leucobacter salsicius TaxID=664638 RepID=UPI00037C29C4|nr:hypothetical protein [Leucobacter salsicius]
MRRTATAALMMGASVMALTGCSSAPNAGNEVSIVPEDSASDVAAAPSLAMSEGPRATGEFKSQDGLTTGRVEVQLKKYGEGDFGEAYSAEITVTDLETPYTWLGIYGTYWDRTADSCADAGFSGGDFNVKSGDDIQATLGATWTWGLEGLQADPQSLGVDAERGETSRLQEIGLTRSQGMQARDGIATDFQSCMNVVIAYAELDWE